MLPWTVSLSDGVQGTNAQVLPLDPMGRFSRQENTGPRTPNPFKTRWSGESSEVMWKTLF